MQNFENPTETVQIVLSPWPFLQLSKMGSKMHEITKRTTLLLFQLLKKSFQAKNSAQKCFSELKSITNFAQKGENVPKCSFSLVYIGMYWYSVVFGGIQQYSVVFSSIQWYSGIRWYSLVFSV